MFLKTEILNALTYRRKNVLPLSYYFWVVLRFILTALPQNGYLHPDEYFQNMEVVAGDIFSLDAARIWEFNATFPLRNIFIPKMVFGPPYYFIQFLNPFTKYYFHLNLRAPYFLLVMPRLFICCLSLINDYCLFRICKLYGQNYRNRLIIFASSYVILIFGCRSFSNTFEMIFFSILLLLVSECMFKSDNIIYHDEFLRDKYNKATSTVEKVKLFKLKKHLPPHSLKAVFYVATVSVLGIFNRPTFIGFALAPVFFWLYRGLGSKVVSFKDFHFRSLVFILSGLPAVFILIIIDSSYYGYLTISEVENLKISLDSFVVTPLNFLMYNISPNNLARHGLHPRWMHFLVNVPLLFNVLGLLALVSLITNIYRFSKGSYSKLPRIQSITGLMILSFILPVGVLSMFPHQEPRFIIPILIPLVFLHGNYLHSTEADGPKTKKLKKYLLTAWFVLNIALTTFYGFIHQAGIYPFTEKLYYEIRKNYGHQIHVITSHSYSIPYSLLQLDSTDKIRLNKATGQKYKLSPQTFFYEYGSLPIENLFIRLENILNQAEKKFIINKKPYKAFLAVPCTLTEVINLVAMNHTKIEIMEDISIYPHFSSEAFPRFPTKHDLFCGVNEDIKLKECQSNYLNTRISTSLHNDQYCNNNMKSLKKKSQENLNMLERISCFISRFCYSVYKVTLNHGHVYYGI